MLERKAVFEARTVRYREMGFDRLAAADFVVASAERLFGPALDIGTGKGLSAIALAKNGLKVTSVDTDTEEQKFAAFLAEEAGQHDRIEFVYGDASSLSYPDNYFGSVVMMEALHHLPDSLTALNEISRVLKPSGILILADFTPEGFDLISKVHRQDGYEHINVGVSVDVAEKILSNKGFVTITRKKGYMHEVVVLKKSLTAEIKQ